MNLAQYVNPLIGTAWQSASGYQGNVAPGAQVPHGMVNFGPDMNRPSYNGSGGYTTQTNANPTSINVNFFSLTHLNGPGCPGAGIVGMMAGATSRAVADQRASVTASTGQGGVPTTPVLSYTPAQETVQLGYFATTVNNAKHEFTSTARTGVARFTYPNKDSGYFSLDTRLNGTSTGSNASDRGKVQDANVTLDVSADGKIITGKTVHPAFCTPYGTFYTSNMYFYMVMDKPLRTQTGTTTVNTIVNKSAVLQYDLTDADLTLNMKVGISPVSVANAKLNLEAESMDLTFDQVRTENVRLWNEKLNLVQIDEAADPSLLTTAQRDRLVSFYTALYRGFVSPTIYSDVNGEYRSFKAPTPLATGVDRYGVVGVRPTENVNNETYIKEDGTVGKPAAHYSGLSMWDTYRTASEVTALFSPDVAGDVMSSLIADAEQCGSIPHWVDGSDDSTPMAGANGVAAMGALRAFGAKDFNLVKGARYVKESVFDGTVRCNGNTAYSGLSVWLAQGSMTNSRSSHTIEAVNVDNAAGNFLSSMPAEVLADPSVNITPADILKLNDRSTFWKNIFAYTQKEVGKRAAPPNGSAPGTLGTLTIPTQSNDQFHESTEPNYFWSFGFAWEDLVDAISKPSAITRLNALFSINDALTNTPTLAQLNGGQSARTLYIGNEPALTSPWAYNWAGKPTGTQYILQKIMSIAFFNARNGFPGNDDYGTTSGFYTFAGMGFFPSMMAQPGLAISTPQWKNMTIWMGGSKVRITQSADPITAPFIKSMTINGRPQDRSYVTLANLFRTGDVTIDYTLTSSPTDTTWGTSLPPREPAVSKAFLSTNKPMQVIGTSAPAVATAIMNFSDNVSSVGSIELREGTTVLGSALFGDGAGVKIVGTGPVNFTLPANLPVGDHVFTAVFTPDDPWRATEAVSAPLNFRVSAEATATDLQVLKVTATVAAKFEAEQSRYTPGSFAALAKALLDARALLAATGQVALDDVTAAVAALSAAMNGLVDAADGSALQALIDIAKGVLADAASYVPTNVAALAKAVTDSEDLLAGSPTQAEITAQAIVLARAINNVIKLGDKTGLNALIGFADTLTATDFTPSSWTPLAAALAAAKAVSANAIASIDDVTDAFQALDDGLSGLKLRAARTGLKSALDVAKSILDSAALYVPASIAGLQAGWDAANAVYLNGDATVSEIATEQANLIGLIAAARLKATPSTPAIAPAAIAALAIEPAVVAVKVAAASVVKLAKPKIVGKAKVAKTLKVKKVAGASYQWFRNGKAIKGAVKASYKVKAADKGKRLSVKVTLAGKSKASKKTALVK